MNIDEADREMYLMIESALKEQRDFTRDEQQYFDKLFDKTMKEMDLKVIGDT